MVMDLAQQYDQTLQETIGRSQRERNRAMRQAQEQGTSQLSNVPGSSSWADRGVEGYRGAGFQEVTAPSVDADTRSFLGNAFGDYTEGGKQQAGYYGTDNPYTLEGAYSLAKKGGYDYAPENLQSQFKSIGQPLPSIYTKSLANQSMRDFGKAFGDFQSQQEDRNKQLFSNVDWESIGGLDQTAKDRIMQEWSPYINAGFLPGQEVAGWKHQARQNVVPGISAVDPSETWKRGETIIRYDPSYGYKKQIPNNRIGLLGQIFQKLDPFLDKIDPLHNPTQKALFNADTTEEQMPYFQKIMPMVLSAFFPAAGAALGVADAGSRGDASGAAGAAFGGMLSGSMQGVDLTGMGPAANAAARGAVQGGVSGLIGGGSLQDMLRGAVSGGLSSGLVGGLGNNVNSALSNLNLPAGVGEALGNFATGAGKGLASNLFNKNTQQSNLEAALTSGLGRSMGGLYNTASGVTNPQQRSENLANATTLAKLFKQRIR